MKFYVNMYVFRARRISHEQRTTHMPRNCTISCVPLYTIPWITEYFAQLLLLLLFICTAIAFC